MHTMTSAGVDKNHDLVSNFIKSDRPLYEEAIRRYTEIHPDQKGRYSITEDAYSCDGVPLPTLNALRQSEEYGTQDCSELWAIFNAVRAEIRGDIPTTIKE